MCQRVTRTGLVAVTTVVGVRTESLEGNVSLTVTPVRTPVEVTMGVTVATPVSSLTGVVDALSPGARRQGVTGAVTVVHVVLPRPDTLGPADVRLVVPGPVAVGRL